MSSTAVSRRLRRLVVPVRCAAVAAGAGSPATAVCSTTGLARVAAAGRRAR